MGNILYKIGGLFYAHPWRVVVGWVLVLGLFGGIAATQFKQPSNAITIPGTAADTALNTLSDRFPDAGKGTGRIVVKTSDAKRLDEYKDPIDAFIKDLGNVEGVAVVVSPFVNKQAMSFDETVAIIQMQLTENVGSVTEATSDEVARKVAELQKATGMQVEMGGDIIQKAPAEVIGVGEIFGLLIAIAVLLIVFQSVRLAGLPLTIALTTVAVAMAGLFALSQVVDITSTTPVLAVMLGIAVGIDYALFIVNKYVRLVRDGLSHQKAAATANATAGSAVIFAALTVVIALAALSVVNIPFMTTMGLAGAATIGLAGLVAVTLTPALLGFVGDKIPSKLVVTSVSHEKRHKVAYAWVRTITSKPWLTIGIVSVIIGSLAWPISSIQLGLPLDQYASKKSTERKAYELVKEAFGEGYNAPLAVVVENVPAVTDQQKKDIRNDLMQQFTTRVAQEEAKLTKQLQTEAAGITTPAQLQAFNQKVAAIEKQATAQKQAALKQIEQGVVELSKRANLQKIANAIAEERNVENVLVGLATEDGTTGVLQVIPETAPFDKKTTKLITSLRSSETQEKLSTFSNVSYGVTGSTALQLDINKKLSEALPVYLSVVVGLSLLVLVLAFRSIVVPIKATLGFILSVLAMFGSLVAVFQWGWFGIAEAPAPIISFIPIIATGILFGLAMDYEFFLVSSMHEAHAEGMKAKDAVIEGFSHSSRVVVAAATIMVSVFGGFITNHDVTIQAIGFGLALGILVDAFLVRLTLVPAVMALVGKAAWWMPNWLQKIVPHVNIEGEAPKKQKNT